MIPFLYSMFQDSVAVLPRNRVFLSEGDFIKKIFIRDF